MRPIETANKALSNLKKQQISSNNNNNKRLGKQKEITRDM